MNLLSGTSFFLLFSLELNNSVKRELITTMITISLLSSGNYFWAIIFCVWYCLCSHVLFFSCGYEILFAIFFFSIIRSQCSSLESFSLNWHKADFSSLQTPQLCYLSSFSSTGEYIDCTISFFSLTIFVPPWVNLSSLTSAT